MFKNEYKNSFGKTYASGVYDKAQKANNWSLCYTLLYALSKNGMRYASAKTGPCSVINTTSLGCASMITAKPQDETGSLKITFNQLVLRIDVTTSSDKKNAFVSNIIVQNTDGKSLGTLVKYNPDCVDTTGLRFTYNNSTCPIFGPSCAPITEWRNDPTTDEERYQVQTATFKADSGNFDICSLHFWAQDLYLGAISFFKAKDYFSSRYKYGFIMQQPPGYIHESQSYDTHDIIYRYADGAKAKLALAFADAGIFTTKVAKSIVIYTNDFAGIIGGINGVYAITDGDTALDSLLPGNRVNINGSDFQAITPGLFARTS